MHIQDPASISWFTTIKADSPVLFWFGFSWKQSLSQGLRAESYLGSNPSK